MTPRIRQALQHAVGDPERLALVTIDLPYALVRRHLLAGTPIPRRAEADITTAAHALLASDRDGDGPGHRGG